MRKIYTIDSKNIAEGMDRVDEKLADLNYDRSRLIKARLVVEETLVILSDHSLADALSAFPC